MEDLQGEIENTIGFKSNSIGETVSEDMLQLVFVKDKKIVASICGRASSLGYRIDFADRIAFADHAAFSVKEDEDVVVLSYTK